MRVLMVEPGTAPYEMEINGLEEMQAAVGGRITASYPFEEQVALVSNEESIWLQMPFNRSVEGGYGASAQDAERFAARTRREAAPHARRMVRHYRTHVQIGSTFDFIKILRESR